MQENIYDLVVEELKGIRQLVKDELVQQFGKVKPFRMEKVSDSKMYDYMNSKYGASAVAQMILEREQLNRRM